MSVRRNLQYWMEHYGYTWIGDKHPTHPVKKPYGMVTFTEETGMREIKSLQ